MEKIRSLDLKPTFKFKSNLDPPWTDRLGTGIKVVSALTLLNTIIVLVLGIISAASVNLSADKAKSDSSYIDGHVMLLHAELIFFYMTIPLVYVAANITENWVLWEDKLRPLYVIAAAVIAINVWILQLTLWGPCLFAPSGGDGLNGPKYCPYLFQNSRVDLDELQTIGSPRMVFYSVPTLFILYTAYLTLGIQAFRRERKRPAKVESFDLSKPHPSSPRSLPGNLDPEATPFRNSWTSRDSSPKTSPDRESYVSPKTSNPYTSEGDKQEEGDATPSLRSEPAIALMLTTPHGTTEKHEEEDPFDDDRLSRLGYRMH